MCLHTHSTTFITLQVREIKVKGANIWTNLLSLGNFRTVVLIKIKKIINILTTFLDSIDYSILRNTVVSISETNLEQNRTKNGLSFGQKRTDKLTYSHTLKWQNYYPSSFCDPLIKIENIKKCLNKMCK